MEVQRGFRGLVVAVWQNLQVEAAAAGDGRGFRWRFGRSCLPESAGGGGSCRLLAEAVGGGLALAVCHNLQVEAAPAGCWQRL